MQKSKADDCIPEIIWIDETGSTNDAAKELIASGPRPGTVISARRQTNGRGQYGRVWLFEEGAAAFSVLLRYEGEIPENLTVRAGECVVAAIEEAAGKRVDGIRIKLPNDILIDDKKVCGILTEGQTMGEITWVVCGIGINVNCEKIPKDLEEIATSIYLKTGRKFDVAALIRGVQRRLMTIC